MTSVIRLRPALDIAVAGREHCVSAAIMFKLSPPIALVGREHCMNSQRMQKLAAHIALARGHVVCIR